MTDVADNEQKEYNPANAPFSWDKLDGLLAYKSSLVTCADILGTSNTTIKNHIKKRYGLTFTDYAEKKLSPTRVKLVQKAIQMADKGNATMLIFCLKNINKWQDRHELEVTELPEIKLAYRKTRGNE